MHQRQDMRKAKGCWLPTGRNGTYPSWTCSRDQTRWSRQWNFPRRMVATSSDISWSCDRYDGRASWRTGRSRTLCRCCLPDRPSRPRRPLPGSCSSHFGDDGSSRSSEAVNARKVPPLYHRYNFVVREWTWPVKKTRGLFRREREKILAAISYRQSCFGEREWTD